MSCDDINIVMQSLQGDCDPLIIGCLVQTDGMPTVDPALDQLPLAYDPATGCIWQFVCELGWTSFCPETPVIVDDCIPTTIGMPQTDPLPNTSTMAYDAIENQIWFFTCESGWVLGDSCCYVPVVIDTPVIYSGRCYGPTPINSKLLDSRDGSFTHAGTPPDSVITFTNPTNEPGVLTFNTTFWWGFYDGQGNTNDKASIVFMIGRKTITDTYNFDENNIAGISATPYIQDDISFDERIFPTEHVYRFWGRGPAECPACITGRSQSTTLTKDFILQGGESIELDVLMGLGFEAIQPTSAGWLGNNRRLTFVGHNKVT